MVGFQYGYSVDPFQKKIEGLNILIKWIDCSGSEESIFDCKIQLGQVDLADDHNPHPYEPEDRDKFAPYACVVCES